MRRLLALLIMLSPAALFPSCTTPAGDACNVYCECEHCNDIADDSVCRYWALQEEWGDIYGCEVEFEAYATCFAEEGECDEEEADYSTRPVEQQGSCTGSFDTGVACTGDPDCQASFPSATCQTTCRYPVCNDGNNIPCSSNGECPATIGEDRCEDEANDYQKCVTEASDDPTLFGIIDVD
jgi:hypothetical protein